MSCRGVDTIQRLRFRNLAFDRTTMRIAGQEAQRQVAGDPSSPRALRQRMARCGTARAGSLQASHPGIRHHVLGDVTIADEPACERVEAPGLLHQVVETQSYVRFRHSPKNRFLGGPDCDERFANPVSFGASSPDLPFDSCPG